MQAQHLWPKRSHCTMRTVAEHFATWHIVDPYSLLCATLLHSQLTRQSTPCGRPFLTLSPEVSYVDVVYHFYNYRVCTNYTFVRSNQINRWWIWNYTFYNKREKFEKKKIIIKILFFWMGYRWLLVTSFRNLWTKCARRGTYYRFRRIVPCEWI